MKCWFCYMNPKSIILGERSQSQKTTYGKVPFMSKIGKSMETASSLVVSRKWGEGKWGINANGFGVSLGGDGNVLGLVISMAQFEVMWQLYLEVQWLGTWCFRYWGPRFNPWSGNSYPTGCAGRPNRNRLRGNSGKQTHPTPAPPCVVAVCCGLLLFAWLVIFLNFFW